MTGCQSRRGRFTWYVTDLDMKQRKIVGLVLAELHVERLIRFDMTMNYQVCQMDTIPVHQQQTD